jgi:hypothetical protein
MNRTIICRRGKGIEKKEIRRRGKLISYELQARHYTFSALVPFLLIVSKCAAFKEKICWI